MTFVETIHARRSIRTYTGDPLKNEHIVQIKQFISQMQTPFGEKAKIELLHVGATEKPIKLGTYGIIKGACDYLALVHEESPFAETAAGYMFEEVLLFCTGLGLGTCWLGGSFSRSDFKKQLSLKSNEKLRIVSPVGYPSNKKRFVDKYIAKADKNHASRKPFGEIFFDKDFENSLTEANAGTLFIPLEMVRIAPSASNKQEWRALLADKVLHFYKKKYMNFESIDMGIALCHFELTCKELGMDGKFEVLEDFPASNNIKYVISWLQS